MEVHLRRGSPEQHALRNQSRPSGQLYPDCAIRHEQYYCMDLHGCPRGSDRRGRERFPKANRVHYDRYNPDGIEGLPVPDLGIGFDFILAFSVFTHTTREEMHDLVGQLRSRLAPDGALVFTFIDSHFHAWLETHRE